MRTNKRYSKELKEQAVKDYLGGMARIDVLMKYDMGSSQLHHWTRQWRAYGDFPDGRGKGSTGRPKSIKTNTDEMTKDEYIAYLEMENEILKYQAVLENKRRK